MDALLLGALILRGLHGPAFGLVRVFDRRAVALTVSMPSSGAETYLYSLTEDTLRKWSGDQAAAEAEVAAATAA